jgi:hypothetical protein
VDAARERAAALEGGLQGDQRPSHVKDWARSVASNASGPRVQNDRQKGRLAADLKVRQVRDPELIRSRRRHSGPPIRVPAGARIVRPNPLKGGVPRQRVRHKRAEDALHPLLIDALSVSAKRVSHAAIAVDRMGVADRKQRLLQRCLGVGPLPRCHGGAQGRHLTGVCDRPITRRRSSVLS